ncbi:MAG: hypothetical protein K2X47_09220 [Bdellovibrionales bacterium]|nr:hypothetical protein [Bdellovibrionales bacterium]
MNLAARFGFVSLSIFASLVVGAVLWNRLFWGVDFTDESYYIAQSLVFSLGTRPYVDEILSMQSAFVLLIPIVQAYRWFQGNLDGVVLFFRQFYFVLTLFFAFFLYRFFRKTMDFPEALLGALVLFCFWPFGIPAFSYNSIGMWSLVLAALLMLDGARAGDPLRNLPGVLIASAISVFCYPTLSAFFLLAGLYLAQKRTDLRQTFSGRLSLGLGLLLFMAGIYLALFHIGLQRIEEIYHYAHSDGQHLDFLKKTIQIVGQLEHDSRFVLGTLAIVTCGLVLFRFHPMASIPLFGLMAFLAIAVSLKGMAVPVNHLLVILLGWFFAPLAAFRVFRRTAEAKDVLALISFGLGIVSAWTSANGLMNASIGSFCGVVVSILFLSSYLELKKVWGRIAFSILCLSFICLQLRELTHLPFGDGPATDLRTVVDFGPFRGLTTSKKKYQFLKTLTEDLKSVLSSERSIAFFDSFPAGYLISDMRMLAPTVFPVTPNLFPVDREFLLTSYSEPDKLPDVFVLMHSLPQTSKRSYDLHLSDQDPVLKLLSQKYESVIARSSYVVYQRSRKTE